MLQFLSATDFFMDQSSFKRICTKPVYTVNLLCPAEFLRHCTIRGRDRLEAKLRSELCFGHIINRNEAVTVKAWLRRTHSTMYYESVLEMLIDSAYRTSLPRL